MHINDKLFDIVMGLVIVFILVCMFIGAYLFITV